MLLGAGCVALLSFVNSLRSNAICEALEVSYRGDTLGLLPEHILRESSMVEGRMPLGNPLAELDTRHIEERLLQLPHLKRAAVYKTIDRKLVMEVEERRPILRLIDAKGKSAWLDSEGTLMPLSAYRHLRLPVLSLPYALEEELLKKGKSVWNTEAEKHLQACYAYALLLDESPFWRAQLQHATLDGQGRLTAFPQVGGHSIHFGDVEALPEKLEALAMLYREGMNAERWNKYSSINLTFKDQIVCTKK